MIVAERKPLEEIMGFIAGYDRVMIAGCGACVTVCFAGGEAEVKTLTSQLNLAYGQEGKKRELIDTTPLRQCEPEYVDPILEEASKCDAVVSMACGVGVNFLAERLETTPVFPALNTSFYGAVEEMGVWVEMCQGCGECILHLTGGICPVARCTKSILNGPCGGTNDGMCEISMPDREVPCGWAAIVERMKKLGTLDKLLEVQAAKDWSTARDGGPRRIVREDLRIQETEEAEAATTQ